MSRLLKKLIIIFSIIVFILFLSLLVAAWSLGAFAPVTLSLKEQGPYYFLTSKTMIYYKDIPQQLENINRFSGQGNHNFGRSGALIYSDLTKIPLDEIVVQAGYIVFDSLEVDTNLIIIEIDKRKVLVVTIETNPSIAVFKIYPSLMNWLERNRKSYHFNFPALELYKDMNFTLEIPLISNKK